MNHDQQLRQQKDQTETRAQNTNPSTKEGFAPKAKQSNNSQQNERARQENCSSKDQKNNSNMKSGSQQN